MYCLINQQDSIFASALSSVTGNNLLESQTISNNVIDGDDFASSFKAWYKRTTRHELKLTSKNASRIAELAKKYYYTEIAPSVTALARKNRTNEQAVKVQQHGYPSINDREEGKRHVGTILLKTFNRFNDNGIKVKGNKYKVYLAEAKKQWNDYLFETIANKKKSTKEQVKKEYNEAEDKASYISDSLGASKMTVMDKNLYAVYEELNGSEKSAIDYIQEVLSDSRLQSINEVIADDVDNEALKLAADANSDLNDINNGDEEGEHDDEYDTMIAVANNHIGTYTNFMTHIGTRIRNYFNTLDKLKSDNENDLDADNRYGIPDVMDANACCSMLYNSADFSNIPAMILSINIIGKTVKGFEAFTKFAKDLQNNRDFANEVFTVFAKTIMDKVEVVVNDGKASVRTANARADKRSAFFFDLRNDIKGTAIEIDPDIINNQIVSLYNTLTNLNKSKNISDEDIDKVKTVIVKLLRQYFPSLDEQAILGYINNNGNAANSNKDKIRNLRELHSILNQTCEASIRTRAAYTARQIKADEVYKHNQALNRDIRSGKYHSPNEYMSTDNIYSTDYVSEQDKSLISLVEKLLPYSVVSTSLNSRNVMGNQSSDVINNSLITKIVKMLRYSTTDVNGNIHNSVLEQWGLDKLRSKQYTYSNLLLEQKDGDKIINKGLFRYVDSPEGKQLVITEYASQLLNIQLFNGSSNLDSDDNVLYSSMTMGDFLPTSYINYFEYQEAKDASVKRASDLVRGNYFLRTPSDAPKTFCITAPRYSIDGLFTISNQDEVNNNITEIINNYNRLSEEEYNAIGFDDNAMPIPIMDEPKFSINGETVLTMSKEEVAGAILGRDLIIKDLRATTEDKEGNTYVKLAIQTENGVKALVFKGKKSKFGAGNGIHNPEFVGVYSKSENKELPEEISDIVAAYYRNKLEQEDVTIGDKTYNKAKYSVNTNHPVFTMFRNQFKQELLDAAIALDHFFEMKNGRVKLEEDGITPVFKKGITNDDGYNFYHKGKHGILTPIKNEANIIVGYKLEGKVFSSNKFTLNIEKDGKVENVNYLDAIISRDELVSGEGFIHFFYGGANKNRKLNIKYDGDQIVDIEFGKKQLQAVDEAISNFLLDYTEQAQEQITKYREFITGTSVTRNRVSDFAINNLLMHYTYDELFEGCTKFYKDGQTILKRAKEYQGSGVPYGIADYTEADSEPIKDIEDSYLETGTYVYTEDEFTTNNEGKKVKTKVKKEVKVKDIFKGTILEGIKQRNKFRAVTIKNSQTTNVEGLKTLIGILEKEGMSHERATQLIYGRDVQYDQNSEPIVDKNTKGFANTKVNDAQSYITMDEWVRRITARGQLQKHIPLIKKLLDPNSTLSDNDIKEFVQVQKNFYYDIWYDDRYGIYVPRQIKNAEFVLVPRLIKGTQLEKVYNMMKEAGIDQLNTVETSKAANERILELWDNDGNISEERYKNFASDAVKTRMEYSYNNLYTQQETPQHMNAQNKAGIQIVKKMIDNLDMSNPKHKRYIKDFFTNFTQNIIESYNDLLDEFKIPRDEDGNIQLENGKIKDIDTKVFYDRLKEEMMRLGLDSNMIDYVTIDPETGFPNMPAFMSNVLSKFESVVQSVFNANITRQKLPGFHAAQITNIGWKSSGEKTYARRTNRTDIINQSEYDALSEEEKAKYIDSRVDYSEHLKYHPDGKGYIEVMVPYSYLGINRQSEHYKNMSDEEILKELEEEGLDIFIGYRIPTEGKQSVCNMKVKGFIQNENGSTIIVPNDWVSQTGSDFDIDSVYTIVAETFKNKDGKVNKIQYIDSNPIDTYIQYLKRNADKSEVKSTSSKINAKFQEIYDSLIDKENEAFEELISLLDDNSAKILKKRLKNAADLAKKENEGADNNTIYQAILSHQSIAIKKAIKKPSKEIRQKLKDFEESLNEIDKFITGQSSGFLEDKIDELSNLAKEEDLYTFEDYSYLTLNFPHKINTRKARNNKILETMINILLDNSNLEENLSRSNFDDIAYWLKQCMNPNVRAERENRSPYNVFDQMKYQEEAMSGAKLKAFSVTLDTFCSVCNVVKPILTRPITVIYNTKDLGTIEELEKRFGKDNVKSLNNGKQVRIIHTTYGHSYDNKNVEGRILTAYSSQTTAYILDAIKEGSIPNVNDYTFAVFKNLLNSGSNYQNAISFIMQPGIDRIVAAYNAKNSIYSSSIDDPIISAIEKIAKELGISVDYKTSTSNILKKIDEQYRKEFNKIFGEEKDKSITMNRVLALDVNKQLARVKRSDNSTPVEELLYDLGTIIQFSQLKSISNKLGDIARCCNPDKFGAKQTVYATNKVFEDIHKILKTDIYDIEGEVTGIDQDKKAILIDNEGKHILEAIYPGISEGLDGIVSNNRISESKYMSLYAFLKYSTATSIVVAREVFDTQKLEFVEAIKGLAKTFTGFNNEVDEKTYNDFQSYLLNYFYKQVESICYPIVMEQTEQGYTIKTAKEIINSDDKSEIASEKDRNNFEMQENEMARIFGYGHLPNLKTIRKEIITIGDEKKTVYHKESFEPVNQSLPTTEELAQFARFSPAQKVNWIKTNFSDPGIFAHIQVSLINGKERGSRKGTQTIEFIEQNIHPNTIYEMFNEAFYNSNPLIVMTAIDVIKYAVQVEGYRMRQRGVSKIIDNDCLIGAFGSEGIGFVDSVRDMLDTIGTINSPIASNINTIYENYLRSHPNLSKIKTVRYNKRTASKFGLIQFNGIIYARQFKSKDEESPEETKARFRTAMCKLGVLSHNPVGDVYKTNSYIRVIDSYKGNRLYKINEVGNDFILYPLNNLETNENSDFSANDSNHTTWHKDVFEALIEELKESQLDKEITASFISNALKEIASSGEIYRTWGKSFKPSTKDAETIDFNLEELAKEKGGGMSYVKDAINAHFENPVTSTTPLRIRSLSLSKYIFSPGIQYASKQTITDKNGKKHTYNIYIPEDLNNWNKHFIGNPEAVKTIKDKNLRSWFEEANEADAKNIDNVFTVVEEVEAPASATSEALISGYNFARLRRNADSAIEDVAFIEKLNSHRITGSQTSIEANMSLVTRETYNYAKAKAETIVRNFKQFIDDPNDSDVKISMTDVRVQDAIAKDQKLMTKYLKTINEAGAFLDTFSIYDQLDTSQEDIEVRHYIEEIKKVLAKVKALPIRDAEMNFNRGYVKSISNNPLIQNDIIDIMDGYYRTTGAQFLFHDIMESGNPLLQTILKDVMGDLDAKRMQATKDVKNFKKAVRTLIDTARNNGKTIDFKKIIKGDHFVRDCSEEFIKKLEELRNTKNEAARMHGYGSIEFLKAKNEYDIFKANHINQPVNPEYYINKTKAEKLMIDEHPVIYERYMQLYYKKLDIYNSMGEGGLTEEERKELNAVELAIVNLTRPGYYVDDNGNIQSRPNREEFVDYSNSDVYKLYSSEEADILSKFLENQKLLNAKYFKYDAVEGFEDMLKKSLRIVESLERRQNGIPTQSMTVLESNPVYVEARNWLRENARFVVKFADYRNGETEQIGDRINKARRILAREANGKSLKINKLMNDANEGNGIYDEKHILDGSLLTDEEIALIKQFQEDNFGISGCPVGTDRILINSVPANTELYTSEFYAGLSGRTVAEQRQVNVEYLAAVTKLNHILEQYYDNVSGMIRFDWISDNEEGYAVLQSIIDGYQEVRKFKGSSTGDKEFIESNVDFEINKTAYTQQYSAARSKSEAFFNLWLKANCEFDENGEYKLEHGTNNIKPNRLIYSYAKPKEEVRDRFLDKERSEAIALLEYCYRDKETIYYEQAQSEALERDRSEPGYYNEWYNKNHVYNPYTRKMEPLTCWRTQEIRYENFNDEEYKGEWVPRSSQRERKIKNGEYEDGIYIPSEDMSNRNYNPNLGNIGNYVKGSQHGLYDNPEAENLNEYEKQMRDFLMNTLLKTARVNSAESYFKSGYVPVEAKEENLDIKGFLNEVGKMFGFSISTSNGNKDWYDNIGYESDITPLMPMTDILMSRNSIKAMTIEAAEAALNEDVSIQIDKNVVKYPERSKYEDEESYRAAYDKHKEILKKVEEHNRKIGQTLISDDYMKTFENYISRAAHYNAVQDNKMKLYYLFNALKRQQIYLREFDSSGDLKTTRASSEDNPVYATKLDEELIKHYKVFLNRILFDQWKEKQGTSTKVANALQGFTSANYMMLNVRGGIANVTLGLTGILGEAAAKEYFDKSELAVGQKIYTTGMMSYVTGMYNEASTTKQDAIIKFFYVVDYDEITGVSRETTLRTYFERARNLAFSPQSMGEHYMQNSVLFAMMNSHKLIALPNDPMNIGYTFMNKEEYIRFREGDLIESLTKSDGSPLFSEEQKRKFAEFKKENTENKNKAKDYAWFRKDMITEWVTLHGTNAQIKAFIEARKQQRKTFEEEFKTKDNLYNQIELGEDGNIKFREGSALAELDNFGSDENVTKAFALLGRFAERVRKVNNKIHGVYNKMGAASIERKWWGSLVMQYHKHLPMGISKRYRGRGYFNETRGTVEKGLVQSIYDMFSLNSRRIKKLNDFNSKEAGVLDNIKFMISHISDYLNLANMAMIAQVLPEYEKANLRRNIGDMIGVLGGMAIVVAVLALRDDDDKDGFWSNLFLYEGDRLMSEAFMYNPIGLYTEGKTLMSTPIAGYSIITDAMQTTWDLTRYLTDEDFEPIYKNGRFAGQNRLGVYVQRRLPMWNGIRNLIDISENNKAYKIGYRPYTLSKKFANTARVMIGKDELD